MFATMALKPTAEAFSEAGTGAAEFGRGNLEAVARSAQVCLTGMQDLGRQYATAVQGLTQHALESGGALAGARSLRDAMTLQASLSRASVERALVEAAKLRQAALALTGRVYAPLVDRASAAVERTEVSRAA